MRSFKKKRARRPSVHFAVSQQHGDRILFGLAMRLLREKWRYRNQAGFMMHESGPPSFYKPVEPGDVEGFEISPVGRGIDGHVPLGFEADVWLPNPAWKWLEANHESAVALDSDDQETRMAVPIKWSEVSAANGKHMDKNAHWGEICGPSTANCASALSPNQNWTWAPYEQDIAQPTVDVPATLLSHWTSSDDRCLSGK